MVGDADGMRIAAIEPTLAAIVALLLAGLDALVLLAARALTRRYAQTSQYGAPDRKGFFYWSASGVGLLVVYSLALGLAPEARGWLLVSFIAVVLCTAILTGARVWLRLRRRAAANDQNAAHPR